MSKTVNFLYKLARTANDVEKLASGDSKKIAKRAKNKILGKTIVNFSHLIKNKIRKELVKLKTVLSTVFNKIYTFSISHVGDSRIEKVEGQRLKTLSLL
jgi:hypothetical protein